MEIKLFDENGKYVTYLICDKDGPKFRDKELEQQLKTKDEKIQELEKENKMKDALLKESISYVVYAERDKYSGGTGFTHFLSKPEIQKYLPEGEV